MLLDREAIDPDLIARLSNAERTGLELVARAHAHGEQLGLKRSTSYRHLLDQGTDSTLTVVVAAPPDRLEPLTWWFPIVGRVSYRGYFDATRAEAFAASLRAQGYETDLRPALLYSTLGWFDDPMPRRLLAMQPYELVDTVLHEQVHETIYVPDDAEYNESLATFVAQHATLDFFARAADTRARAARSFADQRRFAELLAELSLDLEHLYATEGEVRDLATKRERLLAEYQKQRYPALDWQTDRYAGFPDTRVNNAWLVARRTYLGRRPCFERELGQFGNDLRAFIAREREGQSPCREREEAGVAAGAR